MRPVDKEFKEVEKLRRVFARGEKRERKLNKGGGTYFRI